MRITGDLDDILVQRRLTACVVEAFESVLFEQPQDFLAFIERAEGRFAHAAELIFRAVEEAVVAEAAGVHAFEANIENSAVADATCWMDPITQVGERRQT